MIHRALNVACWLGWVMLFVGAMRVGWYIVSSMMVG